MRYSLFVCLLLNDNTFCCHLLIIFLCVYIKRNTYVCNIRIVGESDMHHPSHHGCKRKDRSQKGHQRLNFSSFVRMQSRYVCSEPELSEPTIRKW